jgi:hypothetical protein
MPYYPEAGSVRGAVKVKDSTPKINHHRRNRPGGGAAVAYVLLPAREKENIAVTHLKYLFVRVLGSAVRQGKIYLVKVMRVPGR